MEVTQLATLASDTTSVVLSGFVSGPDVINLQTPRKLSRKRADLESLDLHLFY